MGHLGTIRVGATDLDERLREVLEGSGLEREEFEDLDWFGLLPFFALAGASLRTDVEAHGDHFHFQGVSLEIDDGLEDAFFAVLPQILEQLSDADGAAAEQAGAPDAVVHPSARGEDGSREAEREREEPVAEEGEGREREGPVAEEPEPEPPAGEPVTEDRTSRREAGGAGAAAATGSTATAGARAEPTDDISESPDRDVTR